MKNSINVVVEKYGKEESFANTLVTQAVRDFMHLGRVCRRAFAEKKSIEQFMNSLKGFNFDANDICTFFDAEYNDINVRIYCKEDGYKLDNMFCLRVEAGCDPLELQYDKLEIQQMA